MTAPARKHPRTARALPVLLSEEDGVRMLHLGGTAIQSAMRVDAPQALDLEYTRCMVASLLFRPRPSRVVMVGLGGGSQARFFRHHLPAARTTVVEINAEVVRIARSFFQLPRDTRRFRVVVGDGAEYIAAHPASADLILLDAFENYRQAPGLTSDAFYADARDALTATGVLAINFMGADRNLKTYLRRLEACFDDALLALRARGEGNVVVFAFREFPRIRDGAQFARRAERLERSLGLPFRRYLSELRAPRQIVR